MITNTSTNHSGRKLDLCLFPSMTAPGLTSMEIPGTVPKATAGRNKASQNFARLLLTPLGTWRSDAEAGSNVSSKFLSGIPFTFDQIPSFFAAECLSVIELMARQHQTGTPEDEKIVSSTLVSHTASAGVLSVRIALTYADGAGTELILPVRTGGMLG